jgi:TonB family protein
MGSRFNWFKWLIPGGASLGPRLIKPAPMPVLSAPLESIANELRTIVQCIVGRDGRPRTVHFKTGDGRFFSAIEAVVLQWRWRVEVLDDAACGFCLDIEFVWRSGKCRLGRCTVLGPVFTASSPDNEQLQAEHNGVQKWLQEVPPVGWTGWVRVLINLDPDGSVREATVVEGSERFRNAALEAARQWKFRPSGQLPSQLTLSLASADHRAFVRYGVLRGFSQHF